MDEHFSSVAKLVGVVQVDISSLAFQDEVEARQITDAEVQDLISIFNKSSDGCEPSKPENQITALISPRELDYILQISQLTRDDLQRSLLSGEYPKLNTLNNKIYCLNGRRRIRAAAALADKYWWVIKLYTPQSDEHRKAFLREKAEEFSHQIPFSDGEVYRKVRYYQRQSREDLARDWRIRLTSSKQSCLSRLLGNKNLLRALDELLDFPGLWDGLELGNIKKHLALHCDEEVVRYLRHVYDTWNEITLGDPTIQQAVDIRTVQSLQLRAPSVSATDRDYITYEMDNKALFSTIVDSNLREYIKQALLQLHVVIPTIRSFHENLKYFEIGVRILKAHLLDRPIKTTMYETMYGQWSSPGNTLVEVREGEYQHVLVPERGPPMGFAFAYKQMFLSALRQFPSLSKYTPLQERGQDAIQGAVDPTYSLLFLARAQLLGFRTEKIVNGLENAPETVAAPYVEPISELNSDGEIIKRRWGRPFGNTYKQFKRQLFLPNLLEAQVEVGLNPSAMFVQQDFFNAFFDSTPEIIVTSTATVSVPPTQQSLATHDTIPPPIPISSARTPRETAVTPEPVALSRAEVPLAPEAQRHGIPREPSVLTEQSPEPLVSSEPLVSPEPVALPEQAARGTSISPGIGELLDRFSRTTMDLGYSGYEEVQSQTDMVGQGQNAETMEQRRSFIEVNSTTSEVSEITIQNDQPMSEIDMIADESDNDLLNDTENHGFSGTSPEIDTLEAEVSQDHRSFLIPEPLNSPISVAETEDSHLPESRSRGPSAAVVSQRLRSFLSPEPLGFLTSQANQPSEAWNSRDHRSFLTPGPLSLLPSAARAEDYRASETQSSTLGVLQSHRSFLIPESKSPPAEVSQNHRSFPVLGPDAILAAIPQNHQSFSIRNPPITGASQGPWLPESPMPQVVGNSRDHRSFLMPESRLADQTSGTATTPGPPSHHFEFIEYNGMRKLLKSTQDMDQYLQRRKGWIGMVIKQQTAKTMRFDQIVKHMINNGPSQDVAYALVKAPYAEQFRRNPIRGYGTNEDGDTSI
ncbi:hypothetical protein FGG08_000644 [Glutinoglossum americanum]|uniref:Uncharacterized protein n=1 Tax=Glutinoglossum americanum TaxID=1670608 RepID=A0A9P8ICY5_9PEZI|nr:hypothetical protein FGG08_000644 [Glutinoglossum americanum]